MQPKTTTMPMIENMKHHPRTCKESLAPPVVLGFAVPLECKGFISRSRDSRLLPGVATMLAISDSIRKWSPHHKTSEWLKRLNKVSAVVATVNGLAEGSTAKNSFSPQHPRNFFSSRLRRNVWAVARKKGTTACGPCFARNSLIPRTRIRNNPKPICDSSMPAMHSYITARVKRCEGIPVVGSRHPYIGGTED